MNPPKKDLVGIRFNLLTVVRFLYRDKYGCNFWLCKCDCGNYVTVRGNCLANGNTKSCGCYKTKKAIERNLKHGMTGTRTFNTYNSMIHRCNNNKAKDYSRYGGRGIKVCDRWMESFENFLADMGERPEGKTLDRKYNDGNYCKENCRWSTNKEQQRNRRNTTTINYNGQDKTILEWAEIYNIKPVTLKYRIKIAKWDIEKCFNTPVEKRKEYKYWGTKNTNK